MRRPAGLTLVELLIGLTLSLFVISSGVEFFGLAHRVFARLKTREEAGQAALAALDRMRVDLLHAGRGLAAESAAGLVVPVRAEEGELSTTALERALSLAAAVPAGTTRLPLLSTAGIARGRRIAIMQDGAGEVLSVARVEPDAVVLEGPLEGEYDPASASLSLLESVTYLLDPAGRVLRRRADGGGAQPLLEGTRLAAWTFDADSHLARVRIEVEAEGVHAHETTVFIKNASLAGNRGG
jgi:type II secretory pathway pseudopilin PulG